WCLFISHYITEMRSPQYPRGHCKSVSAFIEDYSSQDNHGPRACPRSCASIFVVNYQGRHGDLPLRLWQHLAACLPSPFGVKCNQFYIGAVKCLIVRPPAWAAILTLAYRLFEDAQLI